MFFHHKVGSKIILLFLSDSSPAPGENQDEVLRKRHGDKEVIYLDVQKLISEFNLCPDEAAESFMQRNFIRLSGFLTENPGRAAAAEAGTGRGRHRGQETHGHRSNAPPVHHQRALRRPAQHHR